ncbi:MAG TPA: lysylphosphatidylglycerol synthase domain-containing protein, partial [Gaiellaceae bacterium]|nr:lysylphosphatidylglycerol synthase domain-containing protein [Gaiellaceae bacterium]
MRPSRDIRARRVAVAAAPLVALAVVASTPQLLGSHLASAWSGLAGASPGWLWLGVAGFLGTVLFTVLSWRSALAAAGAPIGRYDAATRYGVGCLVNSFVPGGVGDAVRVALLSQKLDAPGRLWTTGGAAAAGAALRGVTLALLVLAASLFGALPLWPVFLIWGGTALALALAWL